MPNYLPITKADFTHRRWKRCTHYRFAAQDAVAPLVAQELPRACMSLPIAFIRQGEAFMPAAVQGLQPGQNLLVAADGRWIGPYTPAAYRGYPFQLAKSSDGQSVLVMDVSSGLVSESEGEAFFDDAGNPAESIRQVLDFLKQVQANRAATERACAVLAEHELIQPWPVTVQDDTGKRKVEGLYRIDEAKLNALAADALHRLQQAGALPVAYCQLLSMQHLQSLGKLAQARVPPQSASGDLELEFLIQDGTLNFGNLH